MNFMKFSIDFKSFFRKGAGNVAIEFAFVLPVMLLLLASSFEIVMYSLIKNKITQISGTLVDAISRQELSRAQLQDYLQQISILPFNFDTGNIVISQITNVGKSADPTDMVISWQESFQGGVSEFGMTGDVPIDLPNNFFVVNDQSAIIAEVNYGYSSLVFQSVVGNQTIREVTLAVPYVGNMDKLIGE